MTLTTPCRGCCNPNCPSGVRRCTCLNPNNCPFLRFFEKEKLWEAKRAQRADPLAMTPIRETRKEEKMQRERRKENERATGIPVGYVPGWAKDTDDESDHSGSERDS